jgi:flavin-dependent dehydrogenase
MPDRPTRIAIIGAGPAGTTTAALLAKRGASVVIFDDGRRPELVVGESLIPLMVTAFRELGIEDEVKKFGMHKPGVTFTIDDETEFRLSFQAVAGILPTYSYNVPRREFDQLLLDTALRAGARQITTQVRLEGPQAQGSEVRLAREMLEHIPEWDGVEPDLIIDASGRRRLTAKLLGLNAENGPRTDVAHFAHYTGCILPDPDGQVIISRLRQGWSWRIPLSGGRLSMGVVMNKDAAKAFGATPAEQLEAVIESEPRLRAIAQGRQRVTPVATYANYQLISERASGPGWAAVGDAFGFVDPMLSPGLCMAMESARVLAGCIPPRGGLDAGTPARLRRYGRWFARSLRHWQRLVDYFYDGRIFAIYTAGQAMSARHPGKSAEVIERHISSNLAGMASGAYTSRLYSRALLAALALHSARKKSRTPFAIR